MVGKEYRLGYNKPMHIKTITAREILDSRGNPTVEATIHLENGIMGTASVPSGISTGTYEALELRDSHSDRYEGRGVLHAVKNIEEGISEALRGKDIFNPKALDEVMLNLDGTDNKSKLGANAILAVSLASARAGANAEQLPLYVYLRQIFFPELKKQFILPIPLMNIMNGGAHAGWVTDIQEYMILPQAESMAERIRQGTEVYEALKETISKAGLAQTVGDEGGFAPEAESNTQPFELIIAAIKEAGYRPGVDIQLGIDAAASEWYRNGQYHLKKQGNMDSQTLAKWYDEFLDRYFLTSIEDPFGEDDWSAFSDYTSRSGKKVQIVGDDLYVTNPKRLKQGIQEKATNAILIKPNQIGSLSETVETIKLAQENGLKTIISHRSGETMDDFIADLAVACNAGQIKAGAPARGERVAKYNRLMAIEEELKN